MGQRQPFSAADDNAWLSNLVDTFVRTEEMHDEPCSQAALSAAMNRLQRPALRPSNTSRRAEVLELSF